MPFDSTVVGQPYTRTNRLVIDYPAPNTARVEIIDQKFVRLSDNTHTPIGAETATVFYVMPEDMATEVSLVSPETGVELGASMSYGQIMLGILAAIRAHQQ